MTDDPAIPRILPGGLHNWPMDPETGSAVLGLPTVIDRLPSLAVTPPDYQPLSPEGDFQRLALASGAVIASTLQENRTEVAASYFDAATQMLCRFSCSKPDASGFRLYLYRIPEAFRRAAAIRGASNAQSLYDPRMRDIHMPWPDDASEDWMARILFHETVHAWMDDSFQMTSPLWFCEGMAEYFSTFSLQGGVLVPGAVVPAVLKRLPEKRIPARELMGYDRDRFYGLEFQQLYASAWALVAYLMDKRAADVRRLLLRQSIEVSEPAYGRFYKQLLALRS